VPRREGVLDRAHGLLVCPISCRTLDSELLLCDESEEGGCGGGGNGGDDLAQAGAGIGDCSGVAGGFSLAAAYVAGYECDSVAELQRRCGVPAGWIL
jgi:hypothetical protein